MTCCYLPFSHSIFQLRAQFCAVAMDNTPKEPVCATVAGKGQSVMYPSASVLILRAGAMVLALKGTVSALLATKAKTVRKVNVTIQTIFVQLVLSKECERTKGKTLKSCSSQQLYNSTGREAQEFSASCVVGWWNFYLYFVPVPPPHLRS